MRQTISILFPCLFITMSRFDFSTGTQTLSPLNSTSPALTVSANGGGGTLKVMTGSSNSLFVDANGNVGIGTTLPNTALHVRANTNTTPGTIIDQVGTGAILDIRDAGSSKVIVDANGNVGIGQAVPGSHKLLVDGITRSNGQIYAFRGLSPVNISSSVTADDSKILFYNGSGTNWAGIGVDNQGTYWLRTGTSTTNLFVMTPNGYVGIGNTNPQFPLYIGTSANAGSFNANYWNVNSLGNNFTGTWPVSIKAEQYIWATVGFIAASDSRIKTNIQDIDNEIALHQLRQFKPKTYEYIDKVQKGNNTVNGFIAQEVSEVLPYAVSKQKEIIPSIYAIASIIDGVLTLEKPHDLSVGDKVKLIKQEGGELISTVKEVINATSFTIQDTIEDGRVFVYGKEVSDFQTLDKDAIFTIGVAAVQELDRKVVALEERIAVLEKMILKSI
jgi:hypothetical protein